MGSVFFRKSWAFGKTRNPSICGKAAVGYARIDAVSVTVISGSNKRIVLSASSWFSGVLPAQASAGTRTATPLSAAASTVVSTHQSVATPQTVIFLAPPIASISCCPHLPNVVRSTT